MVNGVKMKEGQDMEKLRKDAIKKAVFASIEDYNSTLTTPHRIGFKLEEKSYGFMLRLPDAKSTEEISRRLEDYNITYERVEGANAIRIFVSKEAADNLAKNAEKFRANHPELYAALQKISEITKRS